jgi:hypothetical protein
VSDFRDLEKGVFRTAKDDGLWDILTAAVVAMLALGPLLSASLGDWWSSAVFLPAWIVIYVGGRWIRDHVVEPRIGAIEVGEQRQRQLQRAGGILLIVNVVALAGGTVAWFGAGADWFDLSGFAYPISLGLTALVGGSAIAFVTGIHRFAAYGLMLAVAPVAGEWLWQNGYASHHGFPVVFGFASTIILVTGVGRFVSLLRDHPAPDNPGIA